MSVLDVPRSTAISDAGKRLPNFIEGQRMTRGLRVAPAADRPALQRRLNITADVSGDKMRS
jgi:hypothetical protein